MSIDEGRRNAIMKGAAVAAVFAALPTNIAAQDQPSSNAAKAPDDLKEKVGALLDQIKSRITSSSQLTGSKTLPEQLLRVALEGTSLYQRSDEWKQIVARAAQYYGLNTTQAGQAKFTPKNIELEFKFSKRVGDESFRFQHTEILMDQAADLLERALAQRAEWNDLMVKAFNVAMDIQEFFDLDKIHQDETKAGFYTHDAIEAGNLYSSENVNDTGLQFQAALIQGVQNEYYNIDKINQQSGYSQLLAVLSHLTNQQFTWNGVTKVLYEHAKDGAAGISFNNLFLQDSMLAPQQSSLSNNAAVARLKAAAYQAKASWESSNSSFRQRRTEVARKLADLKLDSYSTAGGALNYAERMARLKSRFDRDFRDALARLQVAAVGMKALYGYNEPLPDSVLSRLSNPDPQPPGAFDDSLIWVRDAISYLVKFGQVEQKYSLPVSLRRQLGESTFKTGRKAKPWPTWQLSIAPGLFPDQYHVRLRGISIYVVPEDAQSGENTRGIWQAYAKAPAVSFCEHLPVAGSSHREDLDQKNIPTSVCGRVAHRDSPRNADIVGASNLFNVSPYGQWIMKLSPRSTEGVDADDVRDVGLELHAAMRMAI